MFIFIAYAKSKTENNNNKNPYMRITQFSIGLHCQAHKKHRTELVKECLVAKDFFFK
jgi:hypothetical protein